LFVHWDVEDVFAQVGDVEDNMKKMTSWLGAVLALGLAAVPLSAGAQKNGAVNRAAPAAHAPAAHAPAARAFNPGARAFNPGARAFNRGPAFRPQARMSHPNFTARRFSSPNFTRRSPAISRFNTRNRSFTSRSLQRQLHVHRSPQRHNFNRSVQRRLNVNRSVQRRLTTRSVQRQLLNRNARSNAGTNVRTDRTNRAGLTRQARFSSAFAASRTRNNWLGAHRAWRHHHRAHFVGWYGPIFWPYAYSDIFDYTFWPDGYDDGYWAYAYDDFFDGIFWGGYGPAGDDYAYAPSSRSAAPRVRHAAVEQLCNEPGTGITAWPFADIERKVRLTGEQKQLLGDLRDAANQAKSAFKASCPSAGSYPLTPPGRLAAMTARLTATLKSVELVRPPLEKFYNSLSDEQKARFNEIGPSKKLNAEARSALPDQAKACGEAKPGLTNLPIERIQDALKPNDKQRADLDKLGEATVKAVGILQAACPDATPITPPGRLDAMEKRLQAMIEAANTVKAPLGTFYASLSSEQKARFNRLGRALAQND